MTAFIVGLLCFICGLMWGVYSLNKSEGKKAVEGKCTVFDGVVYKYVKVNTDGLEDE